MKRSFPQGIAPLVLAIILVSPGGFAALAAPLSADMIVSVPDQVLALAIAGS